MKTSVLKFNAKVFKAIGHVKRLEIICLLQGHSLTVGQIVQMTELRQAAVSQHLMLLKNLGIVSTEKLGKEMYYSLNSETFSKVSSFIKNLTLLRAQNDAEPTVIDPICHMSLTPSIASYTTEYDGIRHYFCGKGCQKEFHAKYKI
jgi:ArsR family transcriptional regulator